jgi:hypothetical protein
MKNANEVRQELSKVFENLKSGEIKAHEAAEFANIAGKMINSAKVQIEYFARMNNPQKIDFLEE